MSDDRRTMLKSLVGIGLGAGVGAAIIFNPNEATAAPQNSTWPPNTPEMKAMCNIGSQTDPKKPPAAATNTTDVQENYKIVGLFTKRFFFDAFNNPGWVGATEQKIDATKIKWKTAAVALTGWELRRFMTSGNSTTGPGVPDEKEWSDGGMFPYLKSDGFNIVVGCQAIHRDKGGNNQEHWDGFADVLVTLYG